MRASVQLGLVWVVYVAYWAFWRFCFFGSGLAMCFGLLRLATGSFCLNMYVQKIHKLLRAANILIICSCYFMGASPDKHCFRAPRLFVLLVTS